MKTGNVRRGSFVITVIKWLHNNRDCIEIVKSCPMLKEDMKLVEAGLIVLISLFSRLVWLFWFYFN